MTDLQALFTQYIEGNAKEQERAAKQIAQTNGLCLRAAQLPQRKDQAGAHKLLRFLGKRAA